MTSLWWLILFFIEEFFRLERVICRKYTNTNGKDSKHTNIIDIIWLYCRLWWRLFCRLYCRPFLVTQYFFFSLFHKCSNFMTLSDASGMFFSSYYFFLFCHFYLTQNPQGNSFHICRHACFDFFKKFLAIILQHIIFIMRLSPRIFCNYFVFVQKLKEKWIQFLNILFLIQTGRR